MAIRRRRRFRPLPVRSIIPNGITVLAICAGVTAIRFALQDRFELAVAAVFVAMILDNLDGLMARLLRGTSKFGAELDSLSDAISFGVAPGIVLYTWTLHGAGGVGWIAVLVLAVSCALRLARFNTALDDPDRPTFMAKFFVGVPAPGGAGLALLPMIVSFQDIGKVQDYPVFIAIYTIGVGLLMVSRLPTYSAKGVKLPRDNPIVLLLSIGIFAAFLVTYPWLLFTAMGILYLGSIPISIRHCHRLRDQAPSAG